MKVLEFRMEIEPMGAVRTTRQGKYSERAVKYHEWMTKLKWLWINECLQKGLDKQYILPDSIDYIEFGLSINDPSKKSNKNVVSMIGMPHQKKPDLDNLYKALVDSICYKKDDSHIWEVGKMKKIYSDFQKGYIFVRVIQK